jgi:hypothetical protein
MTRFGISRRSGAGGFEPPIELRFVDLFMIIVTALMFTTVVLIIISALAGSGEQVQSPKVLTETTPVAIAGTPYQMMLAASGGSGGYQWSLNEGELAEGLGLSKTGLILGTPQRVQQTHFRVDVVDTKGRTAASKMIELSVNNSSPQASDPTHLMYIEASTILLPDAIGKQFYKTELAVHGGMPPYSWQKVDGPLPGGLSMSSKGTILGTPTEWDAPKTFLVQVSDATGEIATQNLRLSVLPPPPSLWQKALPWLYYAAMLFFFWHGGGGMKHLIKAIRERRRQYR